MNEIVKEVIYDSVVKAAIKRVIAALPFLATPVIGPVLAYILSSLITRLADLLYKELSLFVTFSVIDFQTEQQKRKYEAAVEALKAATQTKNQKEIERAKKEFQDRLRDVIRFPIRMHTSVA
jgi:hypothetical protein